MTLDRFKFIRWVMGHSAETIIKLLPIIAPLTNTPQVIDAVSKGRYTEATLGTALGVGIGAAARVAMLRERRKDLALNASEVTLTEGQELTIPSEVLLYEEPNLLSLDSQISSQKEQE